jgi:anti-sigma factor RsiW
MENENFKTQDEWLDQATAARLAKLRSMPVDTSRLERLVEAQIPRPAARATIRLSQWLRPFRAIAASLLIAGIIGALLFATSGGPAIASAADMAKFHDDLVSGRVAVTHVASVDAANKTLAAEWAQSPRIPNMPADHVMACCMGSVKNKKVACVLMEDSGGPISMTVANASDMQAPASPTVTRGGVTYHVQSVGQLHMVMTERNGRWICLIGKMSADRMMDLASSLEF